MFPVSQDSLPVIKSLKNPNLIKAAGLDIKMEIQESDLIMGRNSAAKTVNLSES